MAERASSARDEEHVCGTLEVQEYLWPSRKAIQNIEISQKLYCRSARLLLSNKYHMRLLVNAFDPSIELALL